MNYEGKVEHFILEEYNIESDADIQSAVTQEIRKLQKYGSRNQWWHFFGRAIKNGKWHTNHKKGIFYRGYRFWNSLMKKRSTSLLLTMKITWALAKQEKLCISVNTVAKVIKSNSHLQSIYQNVQLLMIKHHQKMKAW